MWAGQHVVARVGVELGAVREGALFSLLSMCLTLATPISCNFGTMKQTKQRAVFLILSLCMLQTVLFSEQKWVALPPCLPPATGALHGMTNTSTAQMMMDPNCRATFHLCLFLFSLFLLSLFDVFLKVTFCSYNFGVFWFTSSQCIKTHYPNTASMTMLQTFFDYDLFVWLNNHSFNVT